MGLRLLHTVVSFIQKAQFFTILADETTDCANREQIVFTNRWVDDNLEVHEEFIGIHLIDSIETKIMFSDIEDIILRLNLPVHKIRGQYYDGVSNMSGKKSGVAKLISEKQPKETTVMGNI